MMVTWVDRIILTLVVLLVLPVIAAGGWWFARRLWRLARYTKHKVRG